MTNEIKCVMYLFIRYGGVAELVDALDSKSCSLCEWEFKSPHLYQQVPRLKSRGIFLTENLNALSNNEIKHLSAL